MKRKIDEKLDEWSKLKDSNVLILHGTNNIGKFYAVNQLAERRFKNKIVYDFSEEQVKKLFKNIMSKDDFLLLIGEEIEKNTALIIMKDMDLFNESKLLISLLIEIDDYKFAVTMNRLDRLEINDCGFEEGSLIKMGMMDFEEYLWASKDEYLANQIRYHFENAIPMEESLHKKSLIRFYKYLKFGGYPLVVLNGIKGEELMKTDEMINFHENYIVGMLLKNESATDALRMLSVYDTLTNQLIKANKKFQFSLIRKGATILNYQDVINKLIDCGFVVESSLFNKNSDEDNLELGFKLYYGEIGLFYRKLSAQYGLEFYNMPLNIKEAIIENYIAIQLRLNGYKLCYWESGNTAKIEFVILKNNDSIPIEVMLEHNPKSKNIQIYKEKNNPKMLYRVSFDNFNLKEDIFIIPIYSMFCI